MFSIGEFSKITGLSVKTLRFYHEKGLLVPARVDAGSGYRYYDPAQVDSARIIVALRKLEFALEEISAVVTAHDDDSDILESLEQRKSQLHERMQQDRNIVSIIDDIIRSERAARQLADQAEHHVEEKVLEPLLLAGIRMTCPYHEIGTGFSKLSRSLGRFIAGKPMCLYYNDEYRESDADLEPCMPVRSLVDRDGISVRELPGGRCVSLIHKGPWAEAGRSYERILKYINDHDYATTLPTREVYLKGPGMIFRGNPAKYLTEIQILIEGGS